MSSVREARQIRRRWPVISASVGIAAAVVLGALIALRGSPLAADEELMNELLDERAPWFDLPALFLDWVGGHLVGIVIVPIAMMIWLVAIRRPWAAVFSIVAAAVSAGVVQLLKALFDRARPDFMLVASDEGSFPSGHVANAATIAVVLGLVFGLTQGRRWVWVAGLAYVVAMALARTYLGVHWVTDTIGGAILGAAVAVVLWAPIADKLAAEPRARKSRGG